MSSTPNIQFGPGTAVFIPNSGNTAANPTPIMLKILQEGSIEFKGDLKNLFGQFQGALATARGKVSVTGKMKVGALDVNDLNQIYFGQTVTAGGAVPVLLESHAPSSSVTPLAGTPSAGDGVFVDLGVLNYDTGESMIKVASSPAVGQYSFTPATAGGSPTAASYAFASGETASKVLISYLNTVATGSTLAIGNQLMGFAPESQLYLFGTFRGKNVNVQLNQVTLGMFQIPTKQEDFWVYDLDFTANADITNQYGAIYTS